MVRQEPESKRGKVVAYVKRGKFQRFRSLSEDIVEESPKKELDLRKIIKVP